MAEYSLISNGRRQWSDFIRSIREGEDATIGVDSPAEIDVIRTTAARINGTDGLPYRYSVEANTEIMVVRISTKRPLV